MDEIKRLAEFLRIPISDDICQAINDKCDFKNMVKDKEYDPKDVEEIFTGGFAMYRAGNFSYFAGQIMGYIHIK